MNLGKVGVLAGALTLASCSNETVADRTNDYMADKTRIEVEEVLESYNNRYKSNINSAVCYAQSQSKLDSVAYRDLFETTSKKNDSTVVAEFNQLAAKNRITNYYKSEEKLAQVGLSNKEYNKITKNLSPFMVEDWRRAECLQHKTDSIAYDKFFRKHNLLDDAMTKKIMQVTKKIAPKI